MAGISQIVQYRPLHHTAVSSAFHPMTREISSLPLQGSTAFDIDPHNGFLPSQEPLSRLNGEYEAEWEQMLDRAMQLPLLFAGGSSKYTSNERRRDARLWRKDIRAMPVLQLTPEHLSDIRFTRRSRLVLAYLAHFYIHSQPNPSTKVEVCSASIENSSDGSQDSSFKLYHDHSTLESEEAQGKYKTRLPASIAVPWLIVSQHLDLPPVLTYADTVLWNWHLTDPNLGIRSDNLSITTTFSNSETEHHFLMTSLLIELQGAEALRLIQSALTATHDPQQLIEIFRQLTTVIAAMFDIFVNITNKCIPEVFYWDVRTWFNGSDTSPAIFDEEGNLQREAGIGWTFEGVTKEEDQIIKLSGPSAGQSSVIHSLDVFLGVDHNPHGRIFQPGKTEQPLSFMQKMQKYMPGPHRQYLTQLDQYLHEQALSGNYLIQGKPPHLIQTVAASFAGGCLTSYNKAISMLCSLRDQHMRIVALYIIIPARHPPPMHQDPLSEEMRSKKDEAGRGERGTGGTELVSFLKATRERTRQAHLPM